MTVLRRILYAAKIPGADVTGNHIRRICVNATNRASRMYFALATVIAANVLGRVVNLRVRAGDG
jgi:hypothetical protein